MNIVIFKWNNLQFIIKYWIQSIKIVCIHFYFSENKLKSINSLLKKKTNCFILIGLL